ncbi:MAG TPA: XdhC family protein [Hymenobacter sp.]|jgi:xanthine dehydrogenase accessory factor|uniref:XdhC family protein n=1 Tax=Hymenobacter sp. TaxID=1898978 RepID=UPI002EDBA6EF
MPATPRDLPVWALAAASLRAGTPVALLCVVRSEGSSPGRQGFKMAITPDAVAGSVGGGIMEHKWVELARQQLRETDPAPLLRPQIHRREAPADRSGMMCSGEQDVLLWPLAPADLTAVDAIEKAMTRGTSGALQLSVARGLQFHPEKPGLASPAGAVPFYFYQPGPPWSYREQMGFRERLTIVGGGHVSLALSRVLATLDFHVTVLDDRADLPTFDANEFAHLRRIIRYEDVAREVPAGPNHYVVVMTVGYRTDAVVLRHLLPRAYRYLGVMGSAAKVAELRRGLAEEGFSEQAVAKLRGPIGLPISSQTPEEIAISIAAELIQVRHAALGAG